MKFLAGFMVGGTVGVALFAVMVSLAVGRSMVETQGFAACFQRKQEIAKSIAKPKIIFAGGSSVDLGISAELAQKDLGRPAVNLGLISPLGPDYILSQTRKAAKPGDTVVLALEYLCYDWPGRTKLWFDPMFVKYITAQDPSYLNALPWWYRANILARVSTHHLATALLRNFPKPNTALENTNSHGDRTDNSVEARPLTAAARTKPLAQLKDGLSDDPKGFRAVADFVEWARLHNIQVIATFPNAARNPEYDDVVLSRLEAQLVHFYDSLGVPVVGSLRGSMFPEEDCFDTMFHLVSPAVERRTRELCKYLKNIK